MSWGSTSLFDGDFALAAALDRQHVDANAQLGQSLRLGERVAGVFISVADDDDALGRVGGKHGLGQPQRCRQVRALAVDLAFEAIGQMCRRR